VLVHNVRFPEAVFVTSSGEPLLNDSGYVMTKGSKSLLYNHNIVHLVAIRTMLMMPPTVTKTMSNVPYVRDNSVIIEAICSVLNMIREEDSCIHS
jgi:hypothetical protein